MAAVLAVNGCDREPQTPPPAAPAGTGATGSAALPSWNDGASRTAIVDFVARTASGGSLFPAAASNSCGWTERVYGIPPEQAIGSRAKMKYELRGGVPVLLRLAEIDHVDDKAGKPVGSQQVIGRRPIAAVGNSDGDFEMLEWVTSGPGPRLGVIVHHTDAEAGVGLR
jgi:hypothetical protein